jgi:hypothetical protein
MKLENKSFNEGIRHILEHDKNILMIKCSDKLGVKDYVKEKLNSDDNIIKTLEVSDDMDILFSKIKNNKAHPKNYYIKANNDSGGTCLFKNNQATNLKKIDEIKERKFVPYGVGKGEWFYKDIEYKCFSEELIGENLIDYKWHCAHGKVKACQIIGNRINKTTEICTDINGKALPFHFDTSFLLKDIFPRPSNWNQMKEIAEALCKDFNYVRVDMYNVNNKIYVGELTFAPRAGRYKGNGQIEMGKVLW